MAKLVNRHLGTYLFTVHLDLVTLNLVTTSDLVAIFQEPFFNLLHQIMQSRAGLL